MPVNPMDFLESCLLDLLRELEGKDLRLIICGGFGLYLRQLDLQKRGDTYAPLIPGEVQLARAVRLGQPRLAAAL